MLDLEGSGRQHAAAEVRYRQSQAWGGLVKEPVHRKSWGSIPAAHTTPQLKESLGGMRVGWGGDPGNHRGKAN